MELNLAPKFAQKIFEGEGGTYYRWSSAEYELLKEAKVGGGRLVLQPRGFALPHYADSNRIGYVLQGSCGVVGIVPPKASQEVVLRLKKGDIIPVPSGAVSWWYNDGDSELIIVFLGETSKAYVPGEFTNFLLTGTQGILGGFSTEFNSRAYDINNEEAKKLAKSQSGVLIIKLPEGHKMPHPCKNSTDKLVFNIDAALPDIHVQNAGLLTALTAKKFPFLGEVGLSATLVKLDANAMSSPMYAGDSSVQVIYVAKGSGRIQVVGINGERALDAKVKAGHLLLVPRFFVASAIADGEGLEYFSLITATEPIFGEFTGKTSVWGALSPHVLQASLNVAPEFEQLFRAKIKKSTILVPPQN
ncbi:glutelin type-A 3 [Vitis vinifera]|uniref:Glutelin type-A 2 n=2 Tax=Vitis vinifera TaxID=29760 RepID=A0A438J6W5_VITVI|eukprot:XP_002269868.1 PREDICTED: glutelin type-A 3 [Vitis vinifera]